VQTMNPNPPIDLAQVLYGLLILLGIGFVLTLLLFGWVIWRIKRIKLPQDADFFTALRYTPLTVVVLLDLMDLSMDFLSAPFAWTLLGYLGLKPLRGVTVVESLIPGTQLLPTMTLAWLFARYIDPQRRI